jgi:hypothetical protein
MEYKLLNIFYLARRWKYLASACVMVMPLLSACGSTDIPVSIHGVNYSDQEFTYVLQDVANPANAGGGESIGRYGAGGTMCCFNLPKKWRPGLKIKLDYLYYMPTKPDGTLPKISKSTVVEIERYEEPAEMWVLRNADGTMGILLSEYQPDHPQWPGKVKGWPIPSLAYQRERADLYIDKAKGNVQDYEESLSALKSDPEKTAKKAWDFAMLYEPKTLIGYTGHLDKKYQKHLFNHYSESLSYCRKELKKLEMSRP